MGPEAVSNAVKRCPETLRSRLLRLRFNLYPCYRRTGARITYLAPDWKRVDIVLPLNWKTRGYFGVTFGGSIYGAVDPVLMVMFNQLLGPEIVVWDKRAAIEFLRPGTGALTASFAIAHDEIEAVRNHLKNTRSMERTYRVEMIDKAGKNCARIEKTLYFRRTSNQEWSRKHLTRAFREDFLQLI
jgi:acyl-coenzyme A thioesterase PaaI-like protein